MSPFNPDTETLRQRNIKGVVTKDDGIEGSKAESFQGDGDGENAMKIGTTEATFFQKVASAAFFAVSSFLLVVVNKWILTSYGFPSVQCLALAQVVATVVVLSVAKRLKIVDYPALGWDTASKMMPLPVIYVCNLIFGLGGTGKLSLPMFTVLRRFTILMTMIFEYCVLHKVASPVIQFSVYVMIGGTMVAALSDLSFDAWGYTFVFLNDFFTASQIVLTKQKLNMNYFGKFGVLYYNAFFMSLPLATLSFFLGELDKGWNYDHWTDPVFFFLFALSSVMGFVLMLAQILCTHYNSALTLTVVGCMKNILTTYTGMFIGGDYVFTWLNFVGLNISVSGSILYSYVTFKPPPSEAAKSSPHRVIEKAPLLVEESSEAEPNCIKHGAS